MQTERNAVKKRPKSSIRMSDWVGRANIVFITLDTLRYDVAQRAWQGGQLKNLQQYLPPTGWQKRHSPASFTYAAHHAFFAGFLPTPSKPGIHPRLYASQFGGSESTTESTFVFSEPTLPEALAERGYQTICIGGTGFFNPESSLGRVLPSLFCESHWSPRLGVADPKSELHQFELALKRMVEYRDQLSFTFLNVSAIHQPNWFYASEQATEDSLESHLAALVAVDRQLGKFFSACRDIRETLCIVCSDHGTAYGEQGHFGHRCGLDVVWDVPYAEFLL